MQHAHFADGETENLGQPRRMRVRLGEALCPLRPGDTQALGGHGQCSEGNTLFSCPWLTGQARTRGAPGQYSRASPGPMTPGRPPGAAYL